MATSQLLYDQIVAERTLQKRSSLDTASTQTRGKKARWWYIDVERSWAPWAFAKANDPQRVIATLELLGTLICVMLFHTKARDGKAGTLTLSGSTDNRECASATAKLLST